MQNGIRLMSQVPMIIAAHNHIRNGQDPVPADPELVNAANWLRMLKGQRPSENATRLAALKFILNIEHGIKASSFSAHVTLGSGPNLNEAIVANLQHWRALHTEMQQKT